MPCAALLFALFLVFPNMQPIISQTTMLKSLFFEPSAKAFQVSWRSSERVLSDAVRLLLSKRHRDS